jgi:peptide/nickel transport system permease protein
MKLRLRPDSLLMRLVRETPLGFVGGIITLLLLLTGIFADSLAPYGMNEIDPANALAPPSAEHWMGTDNLGRDVFSRVIYGARTSMIVGLAGAALSVFIGTTLGMLTGYIGTKFDLVTQRVVDAVMSLPLLVVLLMIASIFGNNMGTIILALGILTGISGSRNMRGIILSYKENKYIEAAKAIGCGTGRILYRHLLPNVMPFIITGFAVLVPATIMTEAALSFLGFGVPPPAPSWGGMLGGAGRSYFFLAPWMALWPGVALSLAVFGLSMFGDALRDLLDPRLKGGVGRYGMRADKLAKVLAKKELETGQLQKELYPDE